MVRRVYIGLSNKRIVRHLLFWVVWVFGFTFIKSFGASFDVYKAWFVYYMLTLPLFMAHAYLLVYWMVPLFTKGWRILMFVGFFLVLLFLFSFLELYLSAEVLVDWHPSVFDDSESYKDISTLLINGVGNLYIILVFLATKMVRSWHLSEGEKKSLEQKELMMEWADVNAGVQPEMLLYMTHAIGQLAADGVNDVPASIAKLSELMNDVMQANEVQELRVDEEVGMVKKMLKIYSILNEGREVKLLVSGDDLHRYRIPAFMIFSPVDIILREYEYKNIECLSIDLGEQTKPNKVSFSIKYGRSGSGAFSILPIQELLNSYYPGKYIVCAGADGTGFSLKEVA